MYKQNPVNPIEKQYNNQLKQWIFSKNVTAINIIITNKNFYKPYNILFFFGM